MCFSQCGFLQLNCSTRQVTQTWHRVTVTNVTSPRTKNKKHNQLQEPFFCVCLKLPAKRNLVTCHVHYHLLVMGIVGCNISNSILSGRRSRCIQVLIQHFTKSRMSLVTYVTDLDGLKCCFMWPIKSCSLI